MNDTDTALCQDCQTPVDMPKPCQLNPFLQFQPVPLCKSCILRIKVLNFKRQHLFMQPFKSPRWRPTHAELRIADDASRASLAAFRSESSPVLREAD